MDNQERREGEGSGGVDLGVKKKPEVLVDFTTQRDWTVSHFHLTVPKVVTLFFFLILKWKVEKAPLPLPAV